MKNLILSILLTFSATAFGQNIANAKTVEVGISGNCGMCKTTIETAANKSGEANLDWNKTTKKAQLTYDTAKTSPQDVLKRVAEVGYDNEFYQGNDKAYENLAKCCLYTREAKKTATKIAPIVKTKSEGKSCCSRDAAKKDCSGDMLAKADIKACDDSAMKGDKSCCADKAAASK